MMKQPSLRMLLAGVAVSGLLLGVVAAQQEEQSTTGSPAANAPAPTLTEQGSAEEVMKNLIDQMKQNPLIEPSSEGKSPATAPGSSETPVMPQSGQSSRLGVDPNVIGVAPGNSGASGASGGGKAPKLRREGEFIIARKGRLVRSPDGLHTLFVFEADSEKSPETPMAMIPCQMLQSMEDLVGQRGEQLKFVLSGQILVYRGVNYILPTMMTLAEDRGNLQ